MLSPKIKQARRDRSKSLVMGDSPGLPCRPPSPCRQEPALKRGWLKKQRSIMKNWQQRWFVLRGDQLLYYKNEDEVKPQGFIPLQGNQVNEVAPNPEEPGKYLFEISAGGTAGRDKVPIHHEAFLFMASSQNDMEDWVKAIRRVIWTPFTGGIFGQRLEDTVQYERKYGKHLAPLLVEQCVDFIREHGLAEEGLFRMPGQANLVKELQDSFDCGEKPLFDSNTDVHTVASLLKLYLRELPEPVIPFARYEDFLSCGQLLSKDKGEGTQELARHVRSLPQANYNLLKYICKFLDEVQSHSSHNKMSVQNLATVFGPNILRPQVEDPLAIMEGTSLVQHLMTALISEHGQLFGASLTEGPGQHPHGTIDHLSKDSREDRELESPTVNPVSQLFKAASSAAKEQNSKADCSLPATSPGKRRQTLPAWKYSFRQQGSGSLSHKLGSSLLDSPGFPSGGNWLMNGLYSLQGHCRPSSGGRATGSPQRLSTYDNVPTSGLSVSTHSSTSATWSSSSCELSLAVDSVSSCPACRASDSSALSSLQVEWATASSFPQSEACLDNSGERSGASCSGDSDPNNGASASKDSAHCSGALQSLVAELKAELSKQRIAYDYSIKRIEEANTELRKRVARLEEELDQEKKKYTMLAIKLRNSERARNDADKRNHLLQEEMEAFFKTLGDLTAESQMASTPK
ncbi:rho GTPase-activating protein 22 isoform X1 [Podarcis raffonei]|uniref:rho GTPase-activating protein 22 isoform X1 n=1 Tax=Podarcis raffonei TaxID=65483 RepID=UPI0023299A8E|nr:rho GTPase-activating protein 22 isoform X1 [Podarcis raffonei]